MSISAITAATPSEVISPPLDMSKIPDVWEGFCYAIARHTDKLALACTHQPPDLFGFGSLAPFPPLGCADTSSHINSSDQTPKYLRWSFATLGNAISRLIVAWRNVAVLSPVEKEAIGPGTPVITFLRNGADFVLAAWAAVATGCTFVPMNPLSLKNTEEVMHMLRTALSVVPHGKNRVIFAADEDVARKIDGLGPDILGPSTLRILAAGSYSVDGWIHMEEMMKERAIGHGTERSIFNGTLDGEYHTDGGLVLFTSGTTSRPKGLFVRHTTVNIYTNSRLLLSSPEYLPGPGSSICSVLPNNHGNGWSSIQAAHGRGAALIFPGPAFSTPKAMIATLYSERVTHTMLVSTLVYALAAAVEKHIQPFEHLRCITFGGMGLTRDMLDVATKELGANAVENAYGCTEGVVLSTGSVSTFSSALNVSEHLTGGLYTQEVSVGRPPVGHGIRIVDPETGDIVPRNVAGEIHGCGPMVSRDGKRGYIGDEANNAFYVDEKGGMVWFRTGDRGQMDESGRVFVIGRYKDMIVRGGENISPAAIESILSTKAEIRALNPQVYEVLNPLFRIDADYRSARVGARDDIAGEVPVVVVENVKSYPNIDVTIRETILERMGTKYVPEAIIYLEDIGINDFPRTISGKIQKLKLRELVADYLIGKKHLLIDNSLKEKERQQLSEVVRAIWANAIGLESSSCLDMNTPITELADSISIMRVRDRIRKDTGRALPLETMLQARTVAEQVELLQLTEKGDPSKKTQKGFREQRRRTITTPRSVVRRGPPIMEDMVHLTRDPTLYELTRKLVLRTISPYGLTWDDVEDIVPAYDSNALQAQCGFYETTNFHFAIAPTVRAKKYHLRHALEATMRNHPITCSFMVWESDWASADAKLPEALHVVLYPSSKFFDLTIYDGGVLSTLQDLEAVASGSNTGNGTFLRPEQSTFPGPLYRASLFDITKTGNAAMVISINHAISDHTMGQMLNDDLDLAIELSMSSSPDSTSDDVVEIQSLLPKHEDYKAYLDLHYTLYNSPLSRVSVKWHADRLSSLPAHVNSGVLWPRSSTFLQTSMKRLNKHYEDTNQIKHTFHAPALRDFRREYSHIAVSTIVKAAVALASARKNEYIVTNAKTGAKSRLSVFSSIEAARSHYNPFLPKSTITRDLGNGIEDRLRWEATEVSGPTVQIVCNMVEISISGPETEAETVIQLLSRMQAEQNQQTKYASAPWRAIMGEIMYGGADTGHWPLLPLVHGTLMFNWAPEIGVAKAASDLQEKDNRLANFKNFIMLKSVQKPRVGLVVTAGADAIGGQTSSNIVLLLRGAGLSWDQTRHFAEEIESIVKWLTKKEHANLSVKSVFN